MAIESRCGGCGRLLRVGDEFAGRQARCPQCGFIYTVALASTPGVAGASATGLSGQPQLTPAAEAGLWWMKTPEGQVYGPVPRGQLDDWVRQGRVSDDCQLRQGEHAAWQSAGVTFPALASPRSRATASSPAGFSSYGVAGQQYGQVQHHGTPAYAASYAPAATSYKEPHRGGLILTLGILGWVITCPILSACAWGMGSGDVAKMRSGLMDPEGMGMTQAGQIMGMIQCILFLLSLGAIVLLALCGALAEGM